MRVLPSCGAEHLPCSVKIDDKNAKPDEKVGPRECQMNAVVNPAAIIAMLASASLRADRKAAWVSDPL